MRKKKKKLSTFPSKTVKSLPLLSAWIAFESRHCVSSHTSDFCLLNKRQVWNDLGNFILKSLGSGSTQQKVNLYSCIESGCVSLLSRMDLWKKKINAEDLFITTPGSSQVIQLGTGSPRHFEQSSFTPAGIQIFLLLFLSISIFAHRSSSCFIAKVTPQPRVTSSLSFPCFFRLLVT